MSLTLEPSSGPGLDTAPIAHVECGVPHLWLPDLDANEHTLAELAIALTTLAVDFGDAVLDDTDTDASGAYFAFRAPTQRPASL